MGLLTGEHQLAQIVITPVTMISDAEGKAFPVPDPEGEERVQWGCMVCNMGLDEAKEMPCPGFDMDAAFEEGLDG